MREQVFDVGKSAVAVLGAREFRNFQLAAEFEPLNDGLKVHVAEMFGEDAADGGANQFARNGFGAF